MRFDEDEARAMLLAELTENTAHVPLSASDQIPISVLDKAPRPCMYDKETISALVDLAVTSVLARCPTTTENTCSLTPTSEPRIVSLPVLSVYPNVCDNNGKGLLNDLRNRKSLLSEATQEASSVHWIAAQASTFPGAAAEAKSVLGAAAEAVAAAEASTFSGAAAEALAAEEAESVSGAAAKAELVPGATNEAEPVLDAALSLAPPP